MGVSARESAEDATWAELCSELCNQRAGLLCRDEDAEKVRHHAVRLLADLQEWHAAIPALSSTPTELDAAQRSALALFLCECFENQIELF